MGRTVSYIEYLNPNIRPSKVANVKPKRTEFEKEQLRYFDVIDFKEDKSDAQVLDSKKFRVD